jgi:hypothetical protein
VASLPTLKISRIVGCPSAGGFTDNSAFTTGSTSVTNLSGLFNDTATNLTSGNAGAMRATTDRMLFANIEKMAAPRPRLNERRRRVRRRVDCTDFG